MARFIGIIGIIVILLIAFLMSNNKKKINLKEFFDLKHRSHILALTYS